MKLFFPSVFLAPPVRFINKSDLQELVTCSAQATAQLTAEVSDYDAKVCERIAHHFQLYFQLSQSLDVFLIVC